MSKCEPYWVWQGCGLYSSKTVARLGCIRWYYRAGVAAIPLMARYTLAAICRSVLRCQYEFSPC